MRVAVVGSGIAGLASAWLLSRRHEVVLFEASHQLGGHVHTHTIALHGREYQVDTGFIVHNPAHYPLLTGLFKELDVATQPTTMSFAVRSEASGREYNATSLSTLFCQRRNLWSPRFYGMLRDLFRFYREAPALLDVEGPGPTLGEYLDRNGYGSLFRDEHLVPMACALWSSPSSSILGFPAKYLVRFMANHHMLQASGRPEWRVVTGGSLRYVEAMRARWNVTERIATPVLAVQRHADRVDVLTHRGSESFDEVVLACHSDQALALLADAHPVERFVLGAMRYQPNETVLHTDASLLPRSRKAWAAWNAWVPATPGEACTVSYCMNLLQGIESPEPFVVTLNRSESIDPAKVLRRMTYHHPVYSHASVAAQGCKAEIQGKHRTWFAGAYWGWGFHEDGIRSAVELAHDFDRVATTRRAFA
ncbi:FAD-dependent oxidoreductase [Luteibacter pinisoli]|uniref:FAD-dependent oxidoreductase n=1 Tax=Luteibacter pinisoli TaxID=2589080 RepID=A0A4Y5Z1W3_9GAMM|nr:FAD-dependent oxidoreductase [Luteibacter pinisoli]QDE39272.1 FAD-dependent oxidoreductase [Luteibacter pinisoli]